MKTLSVFLGANSASGFSSLYSQLLSARFDDLLILKGGAGCGKSTFLRTLARAAEGVSETRLEVPCSGDPDSLDAVLFPSLRIGALDGTPPHALEPTYTAVHERVVDLTRFYDLAGVRRQRAEIVQRSDEYRAHYESAYRALAACDRVKRQRRNIVLRSAAWERLSRRTEKIAAEEFSQRGGMAAVDRAFLGGLTWRGEVCRFDTVTALCPRVYELRDTYGLADALLKRILARAMPCSGHILVCPDADCPERLRHLLMPECGAAFITTDGSVPFAGRAHRVLRLDAAAEERITRAERAELRFLRRMECLLREEARQELAAAKSAHDALERAYHPYVDFDGVTALAEEESGRVFKSDGSHGAGADPRGEAEG